MGSEYINVSQLEVGDTIRVNNQLLENITLEELEQIQAEHIEVELLY